MPPKRTLINSERKIISRLMKEIDESVSKCTGPEHNSYYAIEEVLIEWKEKIKDKK